LENKQPSGILAMQFFRTVLPEVIIIEPRVFEDSRGFFMETYQAELFAQAGIDPIFVQDNHSRSIKNTLRGLHYQINHVQGKLVRVVAGEIFDAAVDIRRSSATFGKSIGSLMSAVDKRQIWIPPGFAHGFYVVSEWAEVLYKTTDYYDQKAERVIAWNDPNLDVAWPIASGEMPILSAKDLGGKYLSEAELFE
jgi:dTDP-4-dehydrorhamnose 3,5-epimerase